MMTPRTTLTTEVLHLLEDETFAGSGAGLTVRGLIERTEKGETSIRKAVKELQEGGFVRANDTITGGATHFIAVHKNDDTAEEVNIMEDSTETKPKSAGRPRDPSVAERDGKVMGLIENSPEGKTVAEIGDDLGIGRNAAYLSIWRLRQAGKVVKAATGTRTPRWRKSA